jgi:hypothetical protein
MSLEENKAIVRKFARVHLGNKNSSFRRGE